MHLSIVTRVSVGVRSVTASVLTGVLIGFFALCGASVAHAEAGASDKARACIQSLADQALAVVSQKNLGMSEQEPLLRTLFDRYVDTTWMARFALGPAWRDLQPDMQTRYQQVYAAFVFYNYLPRLKEYDVS